MAGSELRELAKRYEVRIIADAQGDGHLARMPVFPTIFTHGETPEEALANGYEAIECALEGFRMHHRPFPQPDAIPA